MKVNLTFDVPDEFEGTLRRALIQIKAEIISGSVIPSTWAGIQVEQELDKSLTLAIRGLNLGTVTYTQKTGTAGSNENEADRHTRDAAHYDEDRRSADERDAGH